MHKIFSKLRNQSVIFSKRITWCITGAKKGTYDAFQSKYSFSAYVCLIQKSEYGQQQQQQKFHVRFSEDFRREINCNIMNNIKYHICIVGTNV